MNGAPSVTASSGAFFMDLERMIRMYKTIGVLAHVDAGKTTFSEQLLFHMDSIKTKGRVDHQDTFLDNHHIERARGITIFSEQGRFTYEGITYNLIDTPGHVDFAPEMERAITIMDAAILVVSAVEGIQGHTETVWHLLRKHRVPTYIFINKIDREGADIDRLVADLQKEFSSNLLHVTENRETLMEAVASTDEHLMEAYFESVLTEDAVYACMTEQIAHCEMFCAMSGSALQDIGVLPFFELIARTTKPYIADSSTFEAEVFKIRHDQQHQLTFMKILSGQLQNRSEFIIGDVPEKISEMRLYNGTSFQQVQIVEAGDLVAVKGLASPKIGDRLGYGKASNPIFEFVPTLQASVKYEGPLHLKEVIHLFRMLEKEEPSLRVIWNEPFQELAIHVMGAIQLEVLTEIVKERFGLDVTFGKPRILYMETIQDSVVGYGHFEPLKHYAEVHLKLTPNARGAGITFENRCHTDHLSTGHMRLIEKHLFECDHHGLLTGSPVTDIHVTLLTGRAHNEHTSGGDFREATFRALRQGLEQVENVLLEPYYRFKMKAHIDHLGKMMAHIQTAKGQFEAPILTEESATLVGTVPVATFMHYPMQFAAYTNGKGALSLIFDRYDVCHNTSEVIAQIGYDKNSDPLYTSSSIFCAKGKGYSVSWQDAKESMHCSTEYDI